MPLLLLLAGLLMTSLAFAQSAPVAPTPPLGWQSDAAPDPVVLETVVRANADYMAQYLKQHGWQYVVVDSRWAYPMPNDGAASTTAQARSEKGKAAPLLIDAHGRLLPDERRFPSSKGGQGLRPLASYLHGLDLKFGLHVMRGIPRQAVRAKMSILGADGITADQIADTSRVCSCPNQLYGIDMSKPGAQAYYNSLLELYGQWNVDYLIVDDMGKAGSVMYEDEAAALRKAIDELRRPIVLEFLPAQSFASGEPLRKLANVYRMGDGPIPNWEGLKKQVVEGGQWASVAQPGQWPDAGTVMAGKPARQASDTATLRLSEAAQRTQLTLACMLNAALTTEGNLPDSPASMMRLLTNTEALAINQWARQTRVVSTANDVTIWLSDAPDGQTKNVAIFNLSDEPRPVSLDLKTIGISKKANIRDVWEQAYRGQHKKNYVMQIKPQDAVLLRVTPVQ